MKRTLFSADLNNIQINENAYFYQTIGAIKSDNILKYFSQALEDKKAKRVFSPLVRQPITDGTTQFGVFSFDVFKFSQKPPFFKTTDSANLEVKYGYFLIVEVGGYISIIKKYVSGVELLNSVIEPVDYKILAHFLVKESTKFEKVTSSNMNTAELAIQRKSMEAFDLKQIYSRFGASKQVISALRIDNDGIKSSIALNTSRVNTLNLKSDFNKLLFWTVDVLRLIEKAYASLPRSLFIDSFARPVKFEDVIKELKPKYILLRFGELKDEINTQAIERSFIKSSNKEEPCDISNEIGKYERLFELTESTVNEYSCQDFSVRINQKSISISGDRFKDIFIDYGDEHYVSLNQYLNNKNSFVINFDKVDFIYTHRKIFQDSKLLGDVENFLTTFQTYEELKEVKSEKGDNYLETSTSFLKDSIFYFIENILAKDHKCLICDDMGAEWGDFISMNDEEIIFYHAKFHKESLSATNLEEVFGQAQKNFGYMTLTDDMIDYRAKRWMRNFQLDKVQTKIPRIRIYPDHSNPIESIKSYNNLVSSNPNLRRKVFVVTPFLSKRELKEAIYKVKGGNYFHNKGVTVQILWFVNSLLASANDLGAEFRVICKP